MPATEDVDGSSNDGRDIEEDAGHQLNPPDPELVDVVHTLKLQDPEEEGAATESPPVSNQDQAEDYVVPPPPSKVKNGTVGAAASKPKSGVVGSPASKPKNGGAPASKLKNTTTKERKRTKADGATAAVEKTKKKDGLPPVSPSSSLRGAAATPSGRRPTTSGGAVTSSHPLRPGRKLVQPLILKKMSTSSTSANQAQCSDGECSAPSEHILEPNPIEIEDDEEPKEEEEDGPTTGTKRKLTSVVWNEFKRVKYMGTTKAKCMYCFKKLSAETTHGTRHLHDHLKSCTLRKLKTKGNKTLSQSCLRFGSTDSGTIQVENYTFDQDVARKELSAMIILHEYPLSMVDHAGFRRFISALQPLFKMGTRNTIRKDIVLQYEAERKKQLNIWLVLIQGWL